MLDHSGVDYRAIPSSVDEGAIKARLSTAAEIASELAAAKALNVSAQHFGDWVIGSDSLVSVDGRLFDKPRSREEAADHLRFFSGKPMTLTSAVALARGSEVAWSQEDAATLDVRSLSDEFIQSYLDAEWPEVGYCVGVFRLEGRGVQLFDRIEGSYFTILGMPLLPLLGALRERGFLQS
jgi:septum formation protein